MSRRDVDGVQPAWKRATKETSASNLDVVVHICLIVRMNLFRPRPILLDETD